jgi:exopolyphosphatase / guanosine-5'-triphosphate,3'-diphosphate pyrophosphatase
VAGTTDAGTAGQAPPRVVAALDLGSNTIKMTLGRLDDRGELLESGWASDTVRLGAGAAASGRLAEDRVAAALATLRRFADAARAQGATRLIGVATEATRTASNGPEFLAAVREIGWDIQAISGPREAELTFRGLARSIDPAGTVVVADIGGGSTELIVATDGVVTFSDSYPAGSGSLTDRHVVADPPTAAELAACQADAAEIVAAADLPATGADRLVAVGGTGEYLARLVDDPTAVTLPAIDATLARLTQEPSTTLATRLAIPPARARVLPAGVAVVRAVAGRLGGPPVTVAPSGIRTGLLLEALSPTADHPGSPR